MPLARSSGNNRKRIESLKLVLEHIRDTPGGLSVMQLVDVMQIAESTAKGYLRDLFESECITREVCKKERQHPRRLYVVSASQMHIDAFLDSLRYCPCPPTKLSQGERMAKDPSRHFHVADDDEPVKVRVSRVHVPEQWEVLAQFFGMAGAAA